MRRLPLPAGLALLALALLAALLFWQPGTRHARPPGLADAPTGGDFTLQSRDGEVSLRQLRGKLVVLYFGYTWCPDICPTSLSLLTMALNELSKEELARLQVLFVSVDPERDSLQRLAEYGAYFHPSILGVTADPETLRRVAADYGAAYRIVRETGEQDYTVDHSADLYLIDPKGRLVETLPHGTPPRQILAALRRYLQPQENEYE